jgi:hypothetical protein
VELRQESPKSGIHSGKATHGSPLPGHPIWNVPIGNRSCITEKKRQDYQRMEKRKKLLFAENPAGYSAFSRHFN